MIHVIFTLIESFSERSSAVILEETTKIRIEVFQQMIKKFVMISSDISLQDNKQRQIMQRNAFAA